MGKKGFLLHEAIVISIRIWINEIFRQKNHILYNSINLKFKTK